jgi:hypothetical protein
MHSFILEDWLTISGAGGDSVYQEESHWLDLEPFQDVIFYLECREAKTAGATIVFQTAPTKQDSLFQSLVTQTINLTASSTPQVIPALLLSASIPLARFVRWQAVGPAGAWDATFRVLVAANSPGM